MPPPKETLDADFDAQLRGLFQQAERALEHRETSEADPEPSSSVPPTAEAAPPRTPGSSTAPTPGPSLQQALRPILQALEAVVRSASENTATLEKLESAATSKSGVEKDLPQIVGELRGILELKNGVNQSMFAALHEELKGYKDGFLLESVHRPIIRDLISLYDDTAEIQRQATSIASQTSEVDGATVSAQLRTIEINLDHNLDFLLEVLARLEVTLIEPQTTKHDKRTQRVVAVEIAEDPDEDGNVVRIAKRGFLWRSRVFRAEEVVIRRWKEGFLVALTAPGAK